MYEPKIITFLCTWCSYTGADTAGIARLKSPANLRAIRVPCSGRVSPEIIMRTFDQGADGVLVLGCHIGECHYDTGNHRAAKRVPIVRALMTFSGLEQERLRLDWVSASEGERFTRITSEFVEQVRALGPLNWRIERSQARYRSTDLFHEGQPAIGDGQWDGSNQTEAIRAKAKDLLDSGQVGCVIGYEVGLRGITRPAFVYSPAEAERLVWNSSCTHNLTVYLEEKLNKPAKGNERPKPVAVLVKPCDSRAINVLLAEKQIEREQVYAIGMACEGIADGNGGLQSRCLVCSERTPVIYDTLIGEPPVIEKPTVSSKVADLQGLPASQRLEYWLSQFDRCIRCYACRQACPMCDCPSCLYERDDSLWVGLGVGVNEKRTFHLGRAFHLAGRCIGCNECERVCPMNIPIGFLNQMLAQEVEQAYGFRAGLEPVSSPIVTILSGEYQEG